MAKSKSFFGLRRGSTKSLTFQVLNGRQVTKDRVYDVKNPRTFSQMQQRMVMATAAAAYAGMREIVDHSFEGVTYGQPTMSEFIRLNAKMLRQGLTYGTCIYNPYQDRGALPNPYIVSKGTLKKNFSLYLDEIDDSVVYLKLTYDDVDIEQMTVSEFFKHINLSIEDCITVLCVAYSPENKISQFGWVRYTPSGSYLETPLINVELTEMFDIESNIPLQDLGESAGSDEISCTLDFDQGDIMMVSYACILSNKQIQWKRSAEIMSVYHSSLYTPPTPAETLATYPVGTDYILNGGTV